MPRKKGTPKTGGRQKGTPNKATAAVKEYLAEVIGAYLAPAPTTRAAAEMDATPHLDEDLLQMLPAERVRAVAQLAGYIIPKQQAITLDEQAQVEEAALTSWLETAPAEAIDAIAAKVLELQAKNQNTQTAS